MTTVADVDRLVVAADASVAHFWPRLGPKVRNAYLDDRNKWIAIRNAPDKGQSTPPATLETHRRVFTGWVRAFKAVAARPHRPKPAPRPTAPATQAAAPTTASPLTPRVPAPAAMPSLATASRPSGGAGTAVAGGLVLAGFIALAARRRRV